MKKILVVKLSSLGDVLQTTPLINSLSAENRVYFLTFKQNEFLLKNNPCLSKVFCLEDNFKLMSILKNCIVCIKIFFLFFDVSINLHKLYKLNLFFKLIGIKERYGIIRGAESKKNYLTNATVFNQREHHIIQYCKFAKQLGVSCNDYEMKYFPKSEELDIKVNLQKGKYLVCCPSGGKNKWAEMSSKRWGVDCYLQLFKKILKDNNDIQIVLVGGIGDIGINGQILAMLKSNAVLDFTNKLSFDELFWLIKDASCYLGNDSFLLHFSSTTGVKTIGIFGPTSGALLSPLGEKNYYIQSSVDCSPCYDANESNTSIAYSCISKKCMNSILVEDVYSLVKDNYGK